MYIYIDEFRERERERERGWQDGVWDDVHIYRASEVRLGGRLRLRGESESIYTHTYIHISEEQEHINWSQVEERYKNRNWFLKLVIN